MHSSPSLARLYAAVFIVSVGCEDSSARGADAPAASVPTVPEAEANEGTPAQVPASPGMTQVGAPSTPSGASGMSAPAEEDAAAPNPPDPMRSAPSGSGMPDLSCKADADCKAVDSTCGSCRCLILPATMELPMCTGSKVTCVVAPCLNKRAVCSSGMCALKDEGPQTE